MTMRTTLSTFQGAGFAHWSTGSRLAYLGKLLLHVLSAPVRFYAARAQLNRLAGLSDHELRDIGLSRTDLEAASALPLDVEPTAELARLVHERRVNRPRL
jgi:uncharacterized protein YjiS (DUF1127 family)